jgi:GNAT superfamily N-acetyltransferase
MTEPRAVRYRSRPTRGDVAALARLVAVTAVFSREERAIALELLEERLARGRRSSYAFFFAERRGELVGYCCWGRVPLTQRSFDLYWIAVAPDAEGQGVGRALMQLVERAVAARGGGHLYIETTSRRVKPRTRRVNPAAGDRQAARRADVDAPGGQKIMLCKAIRSRDQRARPRRRPAPGPPAAAAISITPPRRGASPGVGGASTAPGDTGWGGGPPNSPRRAIILSGYLWRSAPAPNAPAGARGRLRGPDVSLKNSYN